MKWIKYDVLQSTINTGTAESPVYKDILIGKRIEYNEDNLVIAQREAYNGEYTFEEDEEEFEFEPLSIDKGGTGGRTAEEALKKLKGLSFLGGTMEGHIELHDDPSEDMHPVPKRYFESKMPKLLWSNGSSSSSFSSQTVTLVSMDWDFLIIESDDGVFIVNYLGDVSMIRADNDDTRTIYYYKRDVSVTSRTKVNFGTCYRTRWYYKDYQDTDATNSVLVPNKIYGVKL